MRYSESKSWLLCSEANEDGVYFSFAGPLCLTPLSNNISVISWRSALLLKETGVPGKNHQPVARH